MEKLFSFLPCLLQWQVPAVLAGCGIRAVQKSISENIISLSGSFAFLCNIVYNFIIFSSITLAAIELSQSFVKGISLAA